MYTKGAEQSSNVDAVLDKSLDSVCGEPSSPEAENNLKSISYVENPRKLSRTANADGNASAPKH